MPVRIGILGCGIIARTAHLRSLTRVGGASVVALADPNPANLDDARRLTPDARAVSDYTDVLAMSDVDAVIIALPPSLHADAAIAAIHAGKHVYVEKPLATTVADAERVAAEWQRSTVRAMMGFNYRFNPLVQQAREQIAAGAVGDLVSVRTVFSTPRRSVPDWKQQRESGGGVLLDLAVHHIDLIRFLLATEVARVSADVCSVQSEHDTALLQLGLTNGCSAQAMFSLCTVDDDRFEVYGSSGRLTIDRYRSLRVEVTGAAAGNGLGAAAVRFAGELIGVPYALRKLSAPLHDPSFPAAMEAFVRSIEKGTAVSPTLEDGLRAAAVVDAAELSASSRRVVAIDNRKAPRTQPLVDAAGR
jgi:myo-inositol 2-dehydrogenase/D-chiro-inositol 1-dehydrogenase